MKVNESVRVYTVNLFILKVTKLAMYFIDIYERYFIRGVSVPWPTAESRGLGTVPASVVMFTEIGVVHDLIPFIVYMD